MKAILLLIVSGCLGAATVTLAPRPLNPKYQQTASDQTDEEADQKSDEKEQKDSKEEKSELSIFMRKKLAASNRILEGLVTDDLHLVEEGASRLLHMSDAARWRASNDMMYLHHSHEFRRTVETMRDKAKAKSTDGATLAWVDVTMSCIQCHEWVRNTIVVNGDGPSISGLPLVPPGIQEEIK